MVSLWLAMFALVAFIVARTTSPEKNDVALLQEEIEQPSPQADELRQKRNRRKPSKGKNIISNITNRISQLFEINIDWQASDHEIPVMIEEPIIELSIEKTVFDKNTQIIEPIISPIIEPIIQAEIEEIQNQNIIEKEITDNTPVIKKTVFNIIKNNIKNKMKLAADRVGRSVQKTGFIIKYIKIDLMNNVLDIIKKPQIIDYNINFRINEMNQHFEDATGHRELTSRRSGAIPTVGLYS